MILDREARYLSKLVYKLTELTFEVQRALVERWERLWLEHMKGEEG